MKGRGIFFEPTNFEIRHQEAEDMKVGNFLFLNLDNHWSVGDCIGHQEDSEGFLTLGSARISYTPDDHYG